MTQTFRVFRTFMLRIDLMRVEPGCLARTLTGEVNFLETTARGIRLYVIEPQALFAKALCQLFRAEQRFEVVGEAQEIDEVLLAKSKPDVILLDADNCEPGLIQALQRCYETVPSARICALTMQRSSEIMQRCLGTGGHGFILKDRTPAQLVSAIMAIAAGETYVDPRVAGSWLRKRANKSRSGADLNELSSREIQVIRHIGQGLSNKEISSQLSLSEKTVKNHISRIFSKLDICARSQAAVHAYRLGLV
jgi:DNA-binding NarL/FixJ family response regulator